ncbi:MAG: tetratricopeptide repeat protein [Planctomycetes bacterium]|nr:tetratricopeptide repeat protein [Planctomycetota bacterium]
MSPTTSLLLTLCALLETAQGGAAGLDRRAALERAAAEERAQDFSSAARTVEELLSAAPNDLELLVRAGLLRARGDFHELAQAHLEAAVKLAPSKREVWLALGEAQCRAQRLQGAVESFRKAQILDDADGLPSNGLGAALYFLAQIDEARAALETAAKRNPRLPGPRHMLGRIALDEARYDDAIRWFSECTQMDDRDAESWSRLGVAFQKKAQNEKAIEAYRSALKYDPLDLGARQNLGRLLMDLGRDAEGKAELETHAKLVRGKQRLTLALESLKLEPASVRSRVAVGDALLQLGSHREALSHYREALRGKNPPAAAYLGAAKAFDALGEVSSRDRLAARALEVGRDDAALVTEAKTLMEKPASQPASAPAGKEGVR